MQILLKPEERLVVAADFKPAFPNGRDWLKARVLALLKRLKDTEVRTIQVSSPLRDLGYSFIEEIHEQGFKVFADLQLCGGSETLATDGILLKRFKPEFVTVACRAGPKAMRALKAELPDTQVFGVTVLTSLEEADTQALFKRPTEDALMSLGQFAVDAGIDGLICAPKALRLLRVKFGHTLSLNTPAIRPKWATVSGDDQNPKCVMTPTEAVKAGVDRLIIGRPITEAENTCEAVRHILEEIVSAVKPESPPALRYKT